jgi:ATP-dependent RNA helicase HelY
MTPPATYRGLTLDAFQAEAIEHVEAGRSVLVAAPTGTGKTLIADRVVDRALEQGQRVVYTAPVKALSNQKFRDYCRLHGEENVGLVTGDLVIRRDAPCVVMTTEILRNMLLGSEPLVDLQAVILDEIHYLADRDRGTVWEEVLIYLPSEVQILGLSATLSNLQEFADWLTSVRGSTVEVILEEKRAVPLEVLFTTKATGPLLPDAYDRAFKTWERQHRGEKRQGGRHGGKRNRDRHRHKGRKGPTTRHTDIFEQLSPEYTPYLYFVPSRKQTEAFARALGQRVDQSLLGRKDRASLREALDEALEVLGPDVLDRDLRGLYKKGIAFHHAGLHVQLKALVERLYEAKLLRVLYTTTTFALGINMPARTVVVDGIEEYNGREMRAVTVRQFMQKAGRAGRRGLDEAGSVIVRQEFEDYAKQRPHLLRYLEGASEPVESAFSLSFHSVLRLVEQHEPDAVRELVGRSFLAWRLNARADQLVDQADQLEQGLRSAGWSEELEVVPSRIQKKVKDLRRLRRRAAQGSDRVWHDFQARFRFLMDIGYVQEDGTFNAGAKVLRHVQISEVMTTELVLSGLVHDLEPDLLFGVCCAMTTRLPKDVELHRKPSGECRKAAQAVKRIRYSDVVRASEDISGAEVQWEPDLIAFGLAWAQGRSLAELTLTYWSKTDCSGQLISGFRRAKDLMSQMRQAIIEDEDKATALKKVITAVMRDEVVVIA